MRSVGSSYDATQTVFPLSCATYSLKRNQKTNAKTVSHQKARISKEKEKNQPIQTSFRRACGQHSFYCTILYTVTTNSSETAWFSLSTTKINQSISYRTAFLSEKLIRRVNLVFTFISNVGLPAGLTLRDRRFRICAIELKDNFFSEIIVNLTK